MNITLQSDLQRFKGKLQALYLFIYLRRHLIPFMVVSSGLVMVLSFAILSWYKITIMYIGAILGTESFLNGSNSTVPIWVVFLVSIPSIFFWLLSTRVTRFQTQRMRTLTFLITATALMGVLTWYGLSRVYLYLIPTLENVLSNGAVITGMVDLTQPVMDLALEQRNHFYFLLLVVPSAFTGFISLFFLNKYHQYEEEIKKQFLTYEWRGKLIQRFSLLEETEYFPHIPLGYDADTNEMVYMYGMDRTLNTGIVGAIGTGKSAALGLPMINTDLDHMVKFIDEYELNLENIDYISPEVSGRYLNGISVIDPSNDLCKDVYTLAKAHGIPDEAITYIDPTNPNTPSFNPMRGPTDKVAEVFAEVISGLSSDNGMDFFAQAQRNHLKQYIYLLKEHDPDKDVTFDMLLNMYNDTKITHGMHLRLKNRMPKVIKPEAFISKDEYYYWDIIKGVDNWFNSTLVIERDRQGSPILGDDGQPVIMDAEAEYVKGLRNILNDVGANPLIRRVLFGTSEFDFDRHLAIGGILLVNTAKGELSALSRVLGKIILMNLQNASFRREPKVSPYHHILVDESPEYLYPQFKSFPAQSRKYKVIITILMQTLAQLEDEFGETYKNTLLAALRQKLFYGDATGADAKAFSEISGERLAFKEGESEMETPAIQEDPSTRNNASYQRQVEAVMSQNEVIYQEAFACAVKLVEKNKPMPVRVLKANFVPKELFTEARVKTTDARIDFWLNKRREFKAKNSLQIQSIEESEKEYRETLVELNIPVAEEKFIIQPVPQQAPISESAPAIQYAQDTQVNIHEPAAKTTVPVKETLQKTTKKSLTPGNVSLKGHANQEPSIFDQFVSSSFEQKSATVVPVNTSEDMVPVQPIRAAEEVNTNGSQSNLVSPFGDYDPLEDVAIFNRNMTTSEEVVPVSTQSNGKIYKESAPTAEEEAQLNSLFSSTNEQK